MFKSKGAEEVITKETPLSEVLKIGKECQQKNNCCRHGTGFLAEGDLAKIAAHFKMSEEEVKSKYLDEVEQFNRKLLRPRKKSYQKPYGECVFFDEGCSIHDVKPMQCKIGNCSEFGEELSAWFLLNFILDTDDPEAIRQYDAYVKNGGKVIPGGKLEELIPDKEKLVKIMKYEVLR